MCWRSDTLPGRRRPARSFRPARAWWLVAAAGLVGLRLSAATLQTLWTNGPAANRVNIVVLSEGYTSNQLAQFLVDAPNAVNDLFSVQPYAEYANCFNAFAVAVPSNQSGSSHGGAPPNTYFNSAYSPGDAVVTIPPTWMDVEYSHGQGKVDSLLQALLPGCSNLPIVLVNDQYGGGSGGVSLLADVFAVRWTPGLVVHESGHVLGRLGDEYSLSNVDLSVPDVEEPNTTQQTNRALIKWNAWIAPATPVPTPPTSTYNSVVGLFEGAHYHSNGWFRPRLDCMMNSMTTPFCEVCREALILAVYQRVRPVDSFEPAATNLSGTPGQALSFQLKTVQPATHNLVVQWSTNGTPVTGATDATFTLLPETLGDGNRTVTAEVWDDTANVRNDPGGLLRQTVTWNVNVSQPYLQLDSAQWLAGGRFVFRVSGVAPQGFVVLGSTNLRSWVSLATNALVGGQCLYTNDAAGSLQFRGFRVVTPP